MVELCGGIATGLEAAIKAGLSIASYTWADIDPDAHTTTAHRLTRLQSRHPLLLTAEATNGWDTRLPMDARTITPALFTQAFPEEVDIITTSPPMLTQHLPRTPRGNGQPTHATLQQIHRLIRHLASTQKGGIGFIWDTPVRSPLPAHIIAMAGPSTVLNAPKCGSGAHRPTRIWQNMLPKETLDDAYANLVDPRQTVDDILKSAGLRAWHTPTKDTLTTLGTPYTTLLRFGTGPTPPPAGRIHRRYTDRPLIEGRNPDITLS